MNQTLDTLRSARAISALDQRFAEAMMQLSQDARPGIGLALALTSRSVAHGHVCLDLASLCKRASVTDPSGAPVALSLPSLDAWLTELRGSPLVGSGSQATPLVLDEQHRLYLHRYYQHQCGLAAALRTHAAAINDHVIDSAMLDRLFPPNAASTAPDHQRLAVETALLHRLAVITGGPGTGKTTTVVKLMAALIEHRHTHGLPAPRILLVAPTGKAAARLSESIAAQKPTLACDDVTRAAIVEQASTIHRALGRIRDSATRFRHNADHPLVYDLVVVDEASMVDLPLMRRLFDAIADHARIVLLGDADQLASVEAGAVLGDVCDAARTSGPLQPCLVQLTRSHRYGANSGIGRLATAVRDGDATSALALLTGEQHDDIRLREPGRQGLGSELRAAVTRGFAALQASANAHDALKALARFRVLCAHREGPSGVTTLNPQIEQMLAVDPGSHAHYPRQPVLITHNDHRLRLYNGDVGVVFARPDGGLIATFDAGGDGLREVSLARLPPHETVYAMSVHKSQGSELDHVCIVLPETPSRVLTRELLYTAITRAKHRVEIIAPRDVLRAAITEKVARASGLTDMLRG